MIVMWFSRQREFRADAGGARLAGAENMVGALERLKAGVTQPLPDQLAAFGIAGLGAGGLRRLFTTHPPLEERIARCAETAHRDKSGIEKGGAVDLPAGGSDAAAAAAGGEASGSNHNR